MKNKRQTRITLLAGGFLTAALLSACGPKESGDAATTTAEASPVTDIQLLDTKPGEPLPVQAAREQLKPGDEAVVYGQVGGVKQPFLEGYAGFVLGDTDIMFCNEMGDDHCPSPWDACCEDEDKLKRLRASVQFVDAEGQILSGNVQDIAGLEPLSHVVVKGRVAESSTPENLILKANSIYVGED